MQRFHGDWLFVIIALNLLHLIGRVVTIELIDWVGHCSRDVCVSEVAR